MFKLRIKIYVKYFVWLNSKFSFFFFLYFDILFLVLTSFFKNCELFPTLHKFTLYFYNLINKNILYRMLIEHFKSSIQLD